MKIHPWIWFLLVVIVFLIQLLTLDVLPQLQQDEVQITEYGRLALDPLSEWSVTWLISEEKPLLLWSYLGPLISELSFQVGGASGMGPRIASLLGGMFAGTMMFFWLRTRKTPDLIALGLGLAFLLDPLFVLTQRMGRVDGWVFGFCIASCWFLRRSSNKQKKINSVLYILGAGFCAITASFIWPSAILLYPLIAYEFWAIQKEKKGNSIGWRYLGQKILLFGAGALLATIILIIPVWENLMIILKDLTTLVGNNIEVNKTLNDQLLALFDYQLWFKLIKAYVKTFSPFLPLFAIIALIIRKEKVLFLILVFTIAIIFASLVYEFRALYLLPYFVVAVSGIIAESINNPSKRWIRKLNTFVLSVLIIWSVGISLIVRTTLGFEGEKIRDREKITHAMTSTIGPGDYKVFLGYTYEFYYIGRSLGWELYTPYIEYTYNEKGNWLSDQRYQPEDKMIKLLSKMDYAVFSKDGINSDLQEILASSGLQFQEILNLNEGNTRSYYSINDILPESESRNKHILLYFLRGEVNYGSFAIYSRTPLKDMSLSH